MMPQNSCQQYQHQQQHMYNVMPSVASMSTAAYLSSGIGINYYATSATMNISSACCASSTTSASMQSSNALQQQQQYQYSSVTAAASVASASSNTAQPADPSIRRRLFAGFRPMSGFGRSRARSSQHRSISLPESN